MSRSDSDDLDVADMLHLAKGHESALNHLMERHAERLHLYFIRCLANDEDAADLTQEAFFRVYKHRDRFDPAKRFSTWLFAIAGNLAKDRLRWRLRHPADSMDAENDATEDSFAANLPAEASSPSDSLQHDERGEAVQRAIGNLPMDLRQPLIMAEYDELPHAEIAEILGCTAKAVENRIYRARQRLRRDLANLLDVR